MFLTLTLSTMGFAQTPDLKINVAEASTSATKLWTNELQFDGEYPSGLPDTRDGVKIVGIDRGGNASLFWETTLGEFMDHLGDTLQPLKICRPINSTSHLYSQYPPTMGYNETPDWFQIGDDTLTANYAVSEPKSMTFNLKKYDCETKIILRQNGLLSLARVMVETPRGTELDLVKITMSNPKDSANARSSIYYSYEMERFAESTPSLLSTAETVILGCAYDSADILRSVEENAYLGRNGQYIQCPTVSRQTIFHSTGFGPNMIIDMIKSNSSDSVWVENLSIALRSSSQSFVKIGVNPHQIHPQKNRQMWEDGTWTGVDKKLLQEIVMWKRQGGQDFKKTVFLSDSLENKLLNELHTVSKINFFTYLELNFGTMDDDVRNLFEVSFDHVTKNKFRFQGATNWWVNKYVGDVTGGTPNGRVVRQGSVYTEGQIRKVKRQIPNPI